MLAARSTVAHHVLALTLRHQLSSSTARAFATQAARVQLQDDIDITSSKASTNTVSSGVSSRARAVGPASTSDDALVNSTPREQEPPTPSRTPRSTPRQRRRTPSSSDDLAELAAGDLDLLHPLRFYNLLACVYVLPPDLYPVSRRVQSPPHLPQASTLQRYCELLLSPGVVASENVALPPPDSSAYDQWQLALQTFDEDAIRAVPNLLTLAPPTTVQEWHPHLAHVCAFIAKLQPKKSWQTIEPSRHAALLHLWNEYLRGVGFLHDMGALPRQNTRANRSPFTAPERFTPLFLLLMTEPNADPRFTEARDKRLRVTPPDEPPTIQQGLSLMATLGHEPTIPQLTILLQKLSVEAILANATNNSNNAYGRAMALLADRLANPEGYSKFKTMDKAYAKGGKRRGARLRDYEFAIGEAAQEQLELAVQSDRTPSQHWAKIIEQQRPTWIALARQLAFDTAELAAIGADWQASRKGAVMAIRLLIRDVLLNCPHGALRMQPDVHNGYDFGDPLDLLRLLVGWPSADGQRPKMTKGSYTTANACIVHIARGAARRRLFTPFHKLATILADARFSLPTRTALYIAGAARYPEDLRAVASVLERLVVEPATGDESTHTVQAVLILARQADDLHAQFAVDDSAADCQARMTRLFAMWGLGAIRDKQ